MPRCPDCHAQLPPAAPEGLLRNDPDQILVAVPSAILPALRNALAIARNTAIMSSHPELRDAMEQLRLEVVAMMDEASQVFEPGIWATVVSRAATGAAIDVEARNCGPSWSPRWRVLAIDASGVPWRNHEEIPGVLASEDYSDETSARAAAAAVRKHVERISPLA